MKMKPSSRTWFCWFCFVLALLATASVGRAQEKADPASVQYLAAVQLQNKGAYELAAEQWTTFLKQYQTDSRCDRAFHYLGVCYLKASQLDLALQCFQTVLKTYPKFELLESTYLYLGVTQYTMGQSGKAEKYDDAASTFATLITKYPKGKHLAQALFYCGECLYARGKKKEAAEMYAQLVAKLPEDKLAADALYALGVTQEELGDAAAAGKTYEAFLKKYPENPLSTEVGMRRGESSFAAGQYAEAAKKFAAAAAKSGFALADYATVRQAACLAQMKQYAEAAALYAAVPKKFPQSKQIALANLAGGKCYYLAGNFAEARRLLSGAAGSSGDSGLEAAHWIARSLLKEQKPAEAFAAVEKVLPNAGQSAWAGQLLLDQADAAYDLPDRRKDAAAMYAALAAKSSKDALAPQALYMAGFAALGQGDYKAALQYTSAFLTAYPGHDLSVDVGYVAAESNLQLGQVAEAEKRFADLLQKYPNHADVEAWKVRLGLTLFLQKKYREAIDSLQPLLSNAKNPEALAEALYLVGSSQIELKQADAAAKSLEASLATAPKWRQADETLLALATAYGAANNAEKAKQAVRRLIAEFPNSKVLDRAHYRLGEYCFAAGDAKTAAAEYQQVVEKWPQSPLAPLALYGLGWGRLNQNDFAGAEQAFDAMVGKYPDHKLIARARYARGMARQQLGKFGPAAADVESLLKADPTPTEKADALYVLGLCQVGLKKPAEAVAAFESLLRETPKPAIADKVCYEMGWAQKSLGKEPEAAAAFARLAEVAPDSPLAAESLYHVGEFAYKNNDWKKAAESYQAALEKAGKSELGEKATHKLGWALFRQDDFEAARKAFSSQRATWPDGPLSSDAAFMEGECLMKLQKYDEALAAYALVQKPSGKDFDVLTLLHSAQANGQLKQWKPAQELLQKAAQQFPESTYLPEILYEQGWAQQNLGKPAEATALYEQVIAKTDREVAARAQFMIGEIEFQQQKHAEAVKSFFKVAYGYGFPQWQADATYESGRCFEVLGKKAQAMKQYQELVEKFPKSDKAPLAKERIAALNK